MVTRQRKTLVSFVPSSGSLEVPIELTWPFSSTFDLTLHVVSDADTVRCAIPGAEVPGDV